MTREELIQDVKQYNDRELLWLYWSLYEAYANSRHLGTDNEFVATKLHKFLHEAMRVIWQEICDRGISTEEKILE